MPRRAGMVYLLHFERPHFHARHYIGWTWKDNLEQRVDEHLNGTSRTALLRAVYHARIRVMLARTWSPGSKDLERQLKNRKNAAALCPLCRAAAGHV